MGNTLKGRPRLNLGIEQILEAVRRHGQVVAAAHELGCSDAYIHVRLKRVGLTLRMVLEIPDLGVLLGGGARSLTIFGQKD
jgi:molybdenum-dependent DNA-binding transcriptional regulator ModE